MLYVMLADWKPGLSREQQEGALARRAGWQYPAGAKVVGEFWPATHSPCVISVVDTDDYSVLMEMTFAWQDVFEIHFYPATTPEDGLRMGHAIMQRQAAGNPTA